MDATTIASAGGASVLVVALAGYLLRQIPADRSDYRTNLAGEQARTTAAEARAADAWKYAEALQHRVDEEREKRRDAEAAAAIASAQLLAQRQVMQQWYPYPPPAIGAAQPEPPEQQEAP